MILTLGITVIACAQIVSHSFKTAEEAGPITGFGIVVIMFVPYFIITFALDNQLDDIVLLAVSAVVPTFNLLMCFRELGDAWTNQALYVSSDLWNLERNLAPLLLLQVSS